MKQYRAFTLFELIISMAIIGLIMATIAQFLKREADNRARQGVTNEIVQEMSGFNKFILRHHLDVYDSDNTTIISAFNPLYDEDKNTPYNKRTSNSLNDDIPINNYLVWIDNKNEKDRQYFIDQSCSNSPTDITIGYKQANIDLKCNIDLLAKDSEFSLDRIDLVGNSSNRDINRIDYFITYNPAGDPVSKAELDVYYPNFMKSFQNLNLVYSQANIIERQNKTINSWKLKKIKGTNTPMSFGESILYADQFDSKNEYGIRFSFYLNEGVYLKSDGSIATKKLCWSDKNKGFGPCFIPYEDVFDVTKENEKNNLILTSGQTDKNKQAPGLCWSKNNNTSTACLKMKSSDLEKDPRLHLTQKDKDGNEETGTLVSNIILNDKYYDKKSNKYEIEYRTPVQISYLNFENSGSNIVIKENETLNDKSNKTRMIIPQQTCPLLPDSNEKKLYPRMVATISSFAAVPTSTGDFKNVDLSEQSTSLSASADPLTQGIMGSLILQVKIENDNWIIEAMTTASNWSEAFTYVNAKTISFTALTWCSSISQNAE